MFVPRLAASQSSPVVPPPIAPEVISRNAAGQATVRAVRLAAPLQLDGKLDEAVYQDVPAISDFVQVDPAAGEPATEKTELWLLFDRDSLYVVGRCWDSHPEREIANEMRRDGARIPRNENVAFSLDTFYDRRNGYGFELTPVGGRFDYELTNEGSPNRDWNPVWEAGTSRSDRGWAFEARIPFKSLRYRPGAVQIWGFQARRMVRWKNEISFLTKLPASVGETGHFRVSLAASVVGLEVPESSKNLEIKPYAISSLSSDVTLNPPLSNALKGDWGGDVKYGITKGLTADFTYNTDFAQVEADLQQVNLTRFSLFFPEKRDFFLENAGIFAFGGATGADNTPALFYSRRIGLSGTDAVPIVAGGRVTGRAGKFGIGALDIQADNLPRAGVGATNFSVLRVKRDILRRSSIGAIFTGRSAGSASADTNKAYGLDAAFILTNTVTASAFWAQTQGNRPPGDDMSYRGRFDYLGDRYTVQLEQLGVGANFNPEVGFVRRTDIRRSYGRVLFSPRPRRRSIVRKYYYNSTLEYILTGEGRTDTRTWVEEFGADFQNGDHVQLTYSDFYELVPLPIRLAPNTVVPVGSYRYRSVRGGFNFGPQRKAAAANLTLEYGSFYGGDKSSATVTNGLVSFPPHLMIEPTYTLNRVALPQGSFTSHLFGPRVTYTVTPPMFISALLQYNSLASSVSANVRFRWEYQPGSELFVVLNEQRDTTALGFPTMSNRSVVVKINRLFRL